MSRQKSEKVANGNKCESSVWARAITANSEWPDKEEFLDVIYWSRQAIGIIVGIAWGLIPLKGFVALVLFALVNTGLTYLYFSSYQQVDEEEFGGAWELTKEGFMTSFAGFLKNSTSTLTDGMTSGQRAVMSILPPEKRYIGG